MSRLWTFLPRSGLNLFIFFQQWWLFNNENSHDPMLLKNVIWEKLHTGHLRLYKFIIFFFIFFFLGELILFVDCHSFSSSKLAWIQFYLCKYLYCAKTDKPEIWEQGGQAWCVKTCDTDVKDTRIPLKSPLFPPFRYMTMSFFQSLLHHWGRACATDTSNGRWKAREGNRSRESDPPCLYLAQ